jgi:hypothetical protein
LVDTVEDAAFEDEVTFAGVDWARFAAALSRARAAKTFSGDNQGAPWVAFGGMMIQVIVVTWAIVETRVVTCAN